MFSLQAKPLPLLCPSTSAHTHAVELDILLQGKVHREGMRAPPKCLDAVTVLEQQPSSLREVMA